MQLSGKTILITGASGGIGAAVARALAAQGARLLLTGQTAARLAECQDSLPAGSVLDTIVADLTELAQRSRVVERAEAVGVEVLVNASGVNDLTRFGEQSHEALESLINLNLLVPLQLTRSLLPTLQVSGDGMVVNIGSTFGAIGHAGYVGYCASKFGLRGFSEALRRELAGGGVRVLYFAPRTTTTRMNGSASQWLNERLGNKADLPERVAQKLVAAIQQDKASVHLGWPERFYVLLNQLFPRLVDQGMRRQTNAVEWCLSKNNLSTNGEGL